MDGPGTQPARHGRGSIDAARTPGVIRRGLWVASVIAVLAIAGCTAEQDAPSTPANPPASAPIRAAAFNFGESAVLSWIYALALRDAGFEVDVTQIQPGRTRELLLPMLFDGQVDYVPEYIGSLLGFLGGEPSGDSDANSERASELLAERGVTLLPYAPAEATNAFVVTRDFAESRGIFRLSDLGPIASQLTFGAPPECPVRPFCAVGLREVYGIQFGEFLPLDFRARVTSLANDEIDVALLFTTDAAIAANDWVILEDDRQLEPAENVAIAIRTAIVDAHGAPLTELLGRISASITSEVLTDLNGRVQLGRESPEEVARAWLEDQGAIEKQTGD